LLADAKKKPDETAGKTRLFLTGSLMDDAEFIENVEDMGAVIVADALCFGARYFWDPVKENGDPLEALIDRYYRHVPCPRMAGEYDARLDFILNQIKRADAKGAILQHIKFCDLHGTDNALLKRDLEKQGIASIELEREYGPLADAGRVRTRVQAFLERIGG
jgi:benzoyl-CoA reductase/2-hydroxyglutaryl-CoA dehydratase subunit BcrC/BadD/HgdB